jgi:hypothetical protein
VLTDIATSNTPRDKREKPHIPTPNVMAAVRNPPGTSETHKAAIRLTPARLQSTDQDPSVASFAERRGAGFWAPGAMAVNVFPIRRAGTPLAWSSAEVVMNLRSLRRVPWTCHWGRFGVAVEPLARGESRVDDVFWACHNPTRAAEVQSVERGECEACPSWKVAAHLLE